MVVLDEPFVGIDVTTQQVLLGLLASWHAQGITIVAALHEQDIVRQWFPHTLLLAREMIACGPTAEVLTPDNWAPCRGPFGGSAHAQQPLVRDTGGHRAGHAGGPRTRHPA